MVMSPVIVSGQELTESSCESLLSPAVNRSPLYIYSNELSLSDSRDTIWGTKVYAVHNRENFGPAEAFCSQEHCDYISER